MNQFTTVYKTAYDVLDQRYMYNIQLTDFIPQTPDPPNLSSMIDGLYNRE